MVLSSHALEESILIVGDSISAGYGMEQEQGWVYLLNQRLSEKNIQYKVINLSISGETTGGGLIRLPQAIQRHQPKIVIIELGGNDGLRGYPIDKIRQNLHRMVSLSKDTGAHVLLVGMMLPPNYGRRYSESFHRTFTEVADELKVALLPFLLDGVATQEDLMQRDGIHPNPRAQTMLLDNIWPVIVKLLSS
jgi:acyl-CoA thioesterase-1